MLIFNRLVLHLVPFVSAFLHGCCQLAPRASSEGTVLNSVTVTSLSQHMSNFGPSNRSSTGSAGRAKLPRLCEVSSPREPSQTTRWMSLRPGQNPLRNSKYSRLTFARWSLGGAAATVSNAQRASLIPRQGFKRSQDRIERPVAGLETKVNPPWHWSHRRVRPARPDVEVESMFSDV